MHQQGGLIDSTAGQKLEHLCGSTETFPKMWMFPKNWCTPKSSILIGFSIINHPFWGTTIFGNAHAQAVGRKTPVCCSRHCRQAHELPAPWVVGEDGEAM